MRDYSQMANDDLLTSTAKVIGTAIGKVSTTLHIAEPPPAVPVVKARAKKKSPHKKAAAKKKAAKKAPARKTAARRK